ncbi:hypothetical protein [Alteromonas ponticola]|nr:hypothetical protein [Alteromonas ponticola]
MNTEKFDIIEETLLDNVGGAAALERGFCLEFCLELCFELCFDAV